MFMPLGFGSAGTERSQVEKGPGQDRPKVYLDRANKQGPRTWAYLIESNLAYFVPLICFRRALFLQTAIGDGPT